MSLLSALREDSLFLTQVAFSALAMGFSIAMLIRGEDPSIYLPVLTGTLGYWTPNPQTAASVAGRAQLAAAHPPLLEMAEPPPLPVSTHAAGGDEQA